jgi:hypothetical protein
MGLLRAMAVLAEDWDDVLNRLDPGQARRLRALVAQFVDERDPSASSNLAEAIMDLLVQELPVTHPVVTALLDEDRLDRGLPGAAADRAWSRLAGPLRERLEPPLPPPPRAFRGPPGTSFGDEDDVGPPGTSLGDEDDD